MTGDDPEALEQAIEDAIRAHLSAEGAGYLTNFVVVAAAVSPDDQDITTYGYLTPRQPTHVTRGLLEQGVDWIRDYREED